LIKRFDIVWDNLDPTVGREIKKTRTCLVVSPDELNNKLDTVIIAPVTSTIKEWPFRISLKINGKNSSIAFDQIRSVSKSRLGRPVDKLTGLNKQKVCNILSAMFSE
jgi:mRNA interferase MazF